MYVITGATGNTGKSIVLGLLEAGKKVRIISRSKEKAKDLTEEGAELFEGNSDDVALLKKAFDGADSVYAMLPMTMQAEDVSGTRLKHINAITDALKTSSVKNVVSLSSVGADLNSGTGIVLDLHKMEQSLNTVEGLNVLHLRPSFFMENAFMAIGGIKEMGIMPGVLNEDIAIPAIATSDISKYAVKRLLALDFEGRNVQYLYGANDVSYPDMAKVFGTAIGKPDLQYVKIGYDDLKQALLGMGASQSLGNSMCEFFEAVNTGKVSAPERDSENAQPTSIEDFAPTFKHVYNM